MGRYLWTTLMVVIVAAGCSRSVNVAQEREALMNADREWSQSAKDIPKFMSYFAPEANVSGPNMALVSGTDNIRKTVEPMFTSPGFALQFAPTRAEVGAGGDIGYTAGTYEMTMGGVTDKGKYVTLWKKQQDGSWKVAEDIFNSDMPAVPSAEHIMTTAAKLTWGPAPTALPPGAQLAVVSGDPSKAAPFIVRLQFPAGYAVAPHWHPTDENVTVISGTLALGMGDTLDRAAAQDLPAGSVAVLPAQMHHYAIARTAATVQINGTGPFVVNYVNPADAPAAAADGR